MSDHFCACGCGQEIPNYRKGKLYFNKLHRWNHHNVIQKKELRQFANQIIDLLKANNLYSDVEK